MRALNSVKVSIKKSEVSVLKLIFSVHCVAVCFHIHIERIWLYISSLIQCQNGGGFTELLHHFESVSRQASLSVLRVTPDSSCFTPAEK